MSVVPPEKDEQEEQTEEKMCLENQEQVPIFIEKV
jgi:hypothetical protein